MDEYKDFYIALGSILKEYRERKGLHQSDIAKQLGTTKAAISNYETGYRSISAKALKDYCKAINVSVDEIFKHI